MQWIIHESCGPIRSGKLLLFNLLFNLQFVLYHTCTVWKYCKKSIFVLLRARSSRARLDLKTIYERAKTFRVVLGVIDTMNGDPVLQTARTPLASTVHGMVPIIPMYHTVQILYSTVSYTVPVCHVQSAKIIEIEFQVPLHLNYIILRTFCHT